MRCSRCGNENLDGNRFCGMCGATLLSAPPASPTLRSATPGATAPFAAPSPVRSQTAEAPRVPDDSPVISGPSFLGLSDPAPRKRASLSIDPHSTRGSRNLDYLLDDDEGHRGGGAGKFFLILIALALAIGLGYLRWKNHGFPWLTSGSNKPSAVAQNTTPTDAEPTAPASAPAPSNPAPESQTPASQPAASAQPPADSPSPVDNVAAQPPVTKAPPTAAPPATDAAKPDVPKSDAAKSDAPANSASDSEDEPPAASAKEPENLAPASSPKKPEKPAAAAKQPAPKPSPATLPARTPADPVAEARKYLYGRGAAQDCERGMQILKPAANHSNAKAMIEMGALYSAGLCAPHDLPTAYRWFAMALRRDPESQEAQTDLQKLWGEMTQPERQLAIKLTQ